MSILRGYVIFCLYENKVVRLISLFSWAGILPAVMFPQTSERRYATPATY